MAVIEIARIQVRRGKENTDPGVPQLAPGEFGWAQDTENLYIGKRISEGANTDENSRILTQKDYDNLFLIASGAGRGSVATTSTYRYRDELDYAQFASTTTTIGAKLDAFVSLTDFGVRLSNTATDIYGILNTAIQNLYSNIYLQGNVRRTLKIPAGCYYLSDTVNLPPYTSLEGEGKGLTYILSLNNNVPLFRTVDGKGTEFGGIMEQQSQFSSKHVELKNLTLAFTANTAILPSLINLDNTENSLIEKVEFTRVGIINTSTGTIIINSATTITANGVGISLRGQRRSGIEQNNNIKITDCNFQNIGIGILGTGSVVNATIEESVFTQLTQGINFDSFIGDAARLAPTKASITKNVFNNITQEAIYVGESTDLSNQNPNFLNHSSSFNVFNRVGNGLDLGDYITSNVGTAVITCLGQGFNSINDRFSRKDFANPNFNNNNSFFYRPLVRGNVTVDSGSNIRIKNLLVGRQIIDKLFVSDKPISYKIPYTLCDASTNNFYTRSGLITISVGGNASYSVPNGTLSDYYDFSYDSSWSIATNSSNFEGDELIQPVLKVEPGNNNSHLNLVYDWPVSNDSNLFVGTITNISNSTTAVVSTLAPHGLTSGTLVILTNVQGMNEFFTGERTQVYTSNVTTNTFVINWPLPSTPVDTTILESYNPAINTSTSVFQFPVWNLALQYQINIIS